MVRDAITIHFIRTIFFEFRFLLDYNFRRLVNWISIVSVFLRLLDFWKCFHNNEPDFIILFV